LNRRSLTPSTGTDEPDGLHATRRGGGGARRESADRVILRRESQELCGWALNVSRGGVRVVLEDPVELGQEFDVSIGADEGTPARKGRIVWVQEEHDGMIVGVAFLGASPSEPAPSAPPKLPA